MAAVPRPWTLPLLAACLLNVSPAAARSSPSETSAVRITQRLTPHFRVLGYETSGFYPQVEAGDMNLQSVNSALTRAILADQRAFLPEARREREWLNRNHPRPGDFYRTGSYRTMLYSELTSASTVVVSTLLQVDRSAFVGQPGSHGWLSVTYQAPSGRRVSIEQLFRDADGLRVFGNAWRQSLDLPRRDCIDGGYFGKYSPTKTFFRNFALTPTGLAAAVYTSGACGSWWSIVPYARLRPYLSPLGARLIGGVRKANISQPHEKRGAAVVSVRVLPDRIELWPDRRTSIATDGRVTLRMTLDAGGVRRSRALLKVTLKQGGSAYTKSLKSGHLIPGRERSVVASFPVIPYGPTAVVEVRVRSWGAGGLEAPSDRTSYAASFVLPSSAQVVWNFEALLHDTFGKRTACQGRTTKLEYDFSPRWCSARYGLSTYYWPLFPAARHSVFHLTAKSPKYEPPHHWALIRVNGRFVACDPREQTHLILHTDAANFALDCREPGG
jgi:hypothetical protein